MASILCIIMVEGLAKFGIWAGVNFALRGALGRHFGQNMYCGE